MDEFDKDEFDEFKNFNRKELNRLFRERMQNDEFRKKFMGIIGGYQRDYEGIINLLWGLNNTDSLQDPFLSLNEESFFKNLDFKSFNEDGWEGQSWTSDDGETHISSFSRSFTPEEFYHSEKSRNQMGDGELPTKYVIDLLENKLNEALADENYEEAASLRDTIKSLKESEKLKKEK